MPNPRFNLPNNFHKEDYSFTGFPTRENCDLDDPKQMFLWMLVALPGMRGAQMGFPVSYNMMISEHMHACGARVACENCGHTAEPTRKYQPPSATEPHWMTSPGRWVKPDTPDVQANPAREAINRLTAQAKTEVFRELVKTLTLQERASLLNEIVEGDEPK